MPANSPPGSSLTRGNVTEPFDVESAQVAVQKLYARWEELETKQKD